MLIPVLDTWLALQYFVRSQPNLTLHGTTSDARESERTHWSANRLLQQNGGLVIASRHPIVHSAFHPFGSASLHEAVNWKVGREEQGSPCLEGG